MTKTGNQKTRIVKLCRKTLKLLNEGHPRYVNITVKGDEIWFYCYNILTKSQNKFWDFRD